MKTTARPKIVSGGMSSVADLGRDEAWLQEWLAEDPSRLGLGDLKTADKEPAQDEDGNPAFLASDDDHYFSVDVQIGEMDASHGFQVLDNWARNRVRHPDKAHVAVLVTETAGDRYRTTLEALTEHLPLVVVELQAWRGESEAILVPRIALASDELELTAVTAVTADRATDAATADADVAEADEADADEAGAEDEAATADADGTDASEESTDEKAEEAVAASVADKDDTGVEDPWHLPKADEPSRGTNGAGILSAEMLSNR